MFTLQTDMSATLGNDSAQQIAKKALTTVGSDTNKSGQESPNPNRQDIININVINGGPTNKLGDFRNITNTSGMSNNTNNSSSMCNINSSISSNNIVGCNCNYNCDCSCY